MPILGLTDRGASFPKIGTLRKGAPKMNEKQPGADLKTFFRFDSDDQGALDGFRRLYGDEPNRIRVMLYYPTTAQNFETWQEHYSAGALKHRCDGRTCVLHLRPDGSYSQDPIPCPSLALLEKNPNTDKKHLCRPVGRLKVVIPELARMAYVLVPTTSINDIIELQSNLEAAEALRHDLRGIPFILARRPRKVSTPTENGGRARREKWLLSVEPAPDWVQLQLTAMAQAALPGIVEVKALPAPLVVDVETGELLDEPEDEESDPGAPSLVELRGTVSMIDARYNNGGAFYLKFHLSGSTSATVVAGEPFSLDWHPLLDDGADVTVCGLWAKKPNSSLTYIQAQQLELHSPPAAPAVAAGRDPLFDDAATGAASSNGYPKEEDLPL